MEEKNKPNIKILVACHKADPNIRQDDIYMPIQVGAALHPELDLGFQKDNEGENISHKNESYCELTALYWAWKNLKDVDYIGLCHYRRYFNFKKASIIYEEKEISKEDFQNKFNNLQLNYKLLKNNVIVPISRPIEDPIIKIFSFNHHAIELALLEKIIIKNNPEYKETIKKIFYFKQNIPQRNMFVMPWEVFNNYCNFLFSILQEIEKYDLISRYSLDKRIFGFFGELLLPLFLYHNKIKFKQKNIYFINSNIKKSNLYQFKNWSKFILNKIRFKLNSLPYKLGISTIFSDSMEKQLKNEFPALYKN